jgi:hypothetical protein
VAERAQHPCDPADLIGGLRGRKHHIQIGYAGLQDGVDYHWWDLAKAAGLSTLTIRSGFLRIDNNEYAPANLMPVADLMGRLSEWTTRYLDTPLRWKGEQPSEEEAEAALGLVQREVYARLAPVLLRRLIEGPHPRWVNAFHLRGRGSTFDRARAVQTIFIEGVPVPGPLLDHRSTELLREMQTLVQEAIEAAGGTLLGEPLG